MRCAGMADLRLFERLWGKILVDGLDHGKRRAIALVDVVFCFFEKEPFRYGGFLWMIQYKIT